MRLFPYSFDDRIPTGYRWLTKAVLLVQQTVSIFQMVLLAGTNY